MTIKTDVAEIKKDDGSIKHCCVNCMGAGKGFELIRGNYNVHKDIKICEEVNRLKEGKFGRWEPVLIS